MTNFEGSKEEEDEEEEEEVWPSIRYNSGMPLRGMKKVTTLRARRLISRPR